MMVSRMFYVQYLFFNNLKLLCFELKILILVQSNFFNHVKFEKILPLFTEGKILFF